MYVHKKALLWMESRWWLGSSSLTVWKSRSQIGVSQAGRLLPP